jgi:hypothetical protein
LHTVAGHDGFDEFFDRGREAIGERTRDALQHKRGQGERLRIVRKSRPRKGLRLY